MKVVQNYRVVVSGTEYTAPECRSFHLQGEATWIETQDVPKKVTTSSIVAVNGNVVTTHSGSTYVLGQIAEGFEPFEKVREKHPHVPLG